MNWTQFLEWVLSPGGGMVIGAFVGFGEDLLAWRASADAAVKEGMPRPDFSFKQSIRRVLSRAAIGAGIGTAAG